MNNLKKNKQRKLIYNIRETRKRTLITSIGIISINSTAYINKKTKRKICFIKRNT